MNSTLIVLTLFLTVFALVQSRHAQTEQKDAENEIRWIVIIDEKNRMHLIDPRQQIKSVEVSDEEVTFHYTSRNSEPKELNVLKVHEIKNTDFDPSRRTMFVIHGLNNNKDSLINTGITSALLQAEDWNIFVVDWNDKANSAYPTALGAVPAVGDIVSKFISEIKEITNLELSKLHMCGHSLGAHVAGRAGSNLNGEVATIVGLDPAFPFVSYEDLSKRLDPTDASYVQVIHTNGGILGFLKPLGHADFYPNGGMNQKGCGIDIFGICAHSRSHKYFAESILESNFKAKACDSHDDWKQGLCVDNAESFMGGNFIDTSAKGIYYLDTKESEPFALG